MELKFFRCEHCGNIVTMVKDSGVPVFCCGQKMTQLIPGTVEAAHEKHIPVYTVDGNTVQVTVGSVEHPMLDVHYIEWIAVETDKGVSVKWLKAGDAPKTEFVLAEGEKAAAVYAYCNLHGLWRAEV